jgi:hypothetical protein
MFIFFVNKNAIYFNLPFTQDNHGVGFHDAFHSANLFYALVHFDYVHAADNRHNIILAGDFVDGLHVGDSLDFFGNLLRGIRWVSRKQSYGFCTFGYTDLQ